MAINTQRVVLGGLAGGVVMNVLDFITNNYLLRSMNDANLARLDISAQSVMTGGNIALLVVLDLIAGILLTWLYAAIRPRFGAGGKTAVYAGLVGWLLAGWAWTYTFALGIFPWSAYAPSSIAALVTVLAGTYTGAWLYREDGGVSTA